MKEATLEQLIEDVRKINSSVNVSIPYNLHEFLHTLTEHFLMIKFEKFLREYRSSRNQE